MDDKNIYIVLTYTGTILSKCIRFYTGAEFCHVSISLDEKLEKMYSFGRLNPYIPFVGGFIHEGINVGTFRRFKNTQAEVYSISITDEQYQIIDKVIESMEYTSSLYKFNIIGLFVSALNFKYKRKNCFYCSEFVKYLIDIADLRLELPDLVKPNDFKYTEGLKLRYQGYLRNYSIVK